MTEQAPRSTRPSVFRAVATSEDGMRHVRLSDGAWLRYWRPRSSFWHDGEPIPDTGQSADEVLAAWEKEQSQS